jgi:hypothetical protein
MAIEFVTEVVSEFEHLVGDLKDELGYLAHAIAASVKYDVEKLKGMAVTLIKADISNLWITVKDQAGALWASVKNLPFDQMLAGLHSALLNINWKGVSSNLEGIGAQTLMTLARAAIQMLISGVIGAVAV